MTDDRKKIIKEINQWIEKHCAYKEQGKIKAEINRYSTIDIQQIREFIQNNQELKSDQFKQHLEELKNPQGQHQPDKTKGEFTMDTETTQQLNEEEKFYKNNAEKLGGLNEAQKKLAYETSLLFPDWEEKFAEKLKQQEETSTPEQEGENSNSSTSIDEGQGNAPEPSSNAVEEEWMTDLVTKYKTEYNLDPNDDSKNKYTINGEPNDEGLLITIEPKEGQEGLTGSAVQYYGGTDHFAIRTSKDNVEPKDQSFEHFKHHIAVAKENGSSEITMGNTSSAKFRSKLAAAVFETEGMSLTTPLKDSDSFDFSKESLEGISPETQGKLLKFALENGAAIENPILDFNNEAVKNLPEELKYKYLATLLQNPETKAQLQNIPTVEFYAKDENGNKIEQSRESITVTGSDGQPMKNADGTDRTIKSITYEPNSALKNLSEEELAVLRTSNREQQLAQLKEQTNDDGSKKYDFHDKVAALRNQIKGKTGDERKDIINNANVSEQTHGKNFAAYANKYINPQGRS